MPKYQVEVMETIRRSTIIEVEATDTFEAESKARALYVPECKWQEDELPMRRRVLRIILKKHHE